MKFSERILFFSIVLKQKYYCIFLAALLPDVVDCPEWFALFICCFNLCKKISITVQQCIVAPGADIFFHNQKTSELWTKITGRFLIGKYCNPKKLWLSILKDQFYLYAVFKENIYIKKNTIPNLPWDWCPNYVCFWTTKIYNESSKNKLDIFIFELCIRDPSM